ncbi:DUF2927 domain-containing protein [Rhodoplanes serenus]|uniref:DUF2927 domain-containing protein n=1 Tax=Rhodoplanes serenus TaxID=200615 RepID=A0A9X4XP61_9BRAD|nr:DUF2927 domain-containing protein [Rhodoplanes serenus]
MTTGRSPSSGHRIAAALRAASLAALSVVLSIALPAGLGAGVAAAGPRRAVTSDRGPFTDAQILRGFAAVTGAAEYATSPADRIRRFEAPVRVRIEADPRLGRAGATRRAMVEAVVADIGRGIAHLDLRLAAANEPANLTVLLVRRRDFDAAVAGVFGPERARTILARLAPLCVSGFARDDEFRITRAAAILAVDVSAFDVRDCAYEEILQALGPSADTDAIPWTMFNDRVRTGRFGRYDRYLLNLLYHPRMAAGTPPAEARAIAAAVLPEVRRRVETRPEAGHRRSPPGGRAAPELRH